MYYVIRRDETNHGTHEPNRGTHADMLEDLKKAQRFELASEAVALAENRKAEFGFDYAVVMVEMIYATSFGEGLRIVNARKALALATLSENNPPKTGDERAPIVHNVTVADGFVAKTAT